MANIDIPREKLAEDLGELLIEASKIMKALPDLRAYLLSMTNPGMKLAKSDSDEAWRLLDLIGRGP